MLQQITSQSANNFPIHHFSHVSLSSAHPSSWTIVAKKEKKRKRKLFAEHSWVKQKKVSPRVSRNFSSQTVSALRIEKILISLFRFLDTMPQRHVLHSKKWTRKGTAQHEKSKFDMYDTVWLFWGIMLLEPFPKKAEKLNYRIERFIGWSVSFREIPCCRHSVWCAAFPDSLSH